VQDVAELHIRLQRRGHRVENHHGELFGVLGVGVRIFGALGNVVHRLVQVSGRVLRLGRRMLHPLGVAYLIQQAQQSAAEVAQIRGGQLRQRRVLLDPVLQHFARIVLIDRLAQA
jgi:hypothetical protein